MANPELVPRIACNQFGHRSGLQKKKLWDQKKFVLALVSKITLDAPGLIPGVPEKKFEEAFFLVGEK